MQIYTKNFNVISRKVNGMEVGNLSYAYTVVNKIK